MAEPKEWEKSVWRQQYFRDYEEFIASLLEVKEQLEEGVGCNPYHTSWWARLQQKMDLLSHSHSVLEVTRRKFIEAVPLEKSIPFGHMPVVK